MRPAPFHPQEAERLQSLRSLEILDTQGEQAYDELTQLASEIAGTEIALISLVDEDRQWFKAKHGLDAPETPRDLAFCSHAILSPDEPFVVTDASRDERFHDNPLVTEEPSIRFYAGIPLRSPVDDLPMGTLCAISPRVMTLPKHKIEQLKILAHQVERLLALRRTGIELRIHSDALDVARIAAESANEAKTRFLATISHDMRTPLNGLVGTLDMLDEKLENREQHEMAKTAGSCARVLLQLVNDTLELSKIESGTLELVKKPFDPAKVIEETARVVGATLNGKPVELKTVIHGGTGSMLLGDELRCQQVILNLLSNAAKFTKEGTITVNSQIEDGEWIVTVSDTGPGIPAADLVQIFEPYVQSESGRRSQIGGAGLGLNICKRICEMLDGGITVSSTLGIGSTFTARMVLPSTSGESEKNLPKRLELPPLSVLIAEDDRVSREILTAQLKRIGCKVTVTEEGESALEELRNGEYDVALLDYNMPGLTGPEVTESYRETEAYDQHLPILATTAHGFEVDRHTCESAGMDSMLIKPFTQVELERRLYQFTVEAPETRDLHLGGRRNEEVSRLRKG